MKNAPDMGFDNQKPAAPGIQAHHDRQGRRQRLAVGETHKRNVLGRQITFTLKRIPHAEIEQRTQVWEFNERDQELLTDAALSDILPTFQDGGEQEEPAYGRRLADDRYETADGSRRRMACIKTGNDYLIWEADLSDDEMEHISQLGNKYLPPSAYERGCRYLRLLETRYNSVKALAEAENVDRNIINRCMNTARLPRKIIKLYRTVNDISARTGDTLHKALCTEMKDLASIPEFQKEAPTLPPEQVTAALLDTCKPKAKEAPARTWNDDALRIDRNGGKGLKVEISDDVPEAVLEKIEKILRKELQIEEQGK